MLVGRDDLPEVRRFTLDGTLTQIVRFPGPSVLITDSMWADYEWYWMTEPATSLDQRARARLFAQINPPIGKPLPYFGKLFGDDLGNLWVGAYSTAPRCTRRLRVFSPSGDWLGSLTLPPHFEVVDIRYGRILGVQYDDLGVNAVVLYRIEG
jgi:hypothetical protein